MITYNKVIHETSPIALIASSQSSYNKLSHTLITPTQLATNYEDVHANICRKTPLSKGEHVTQAQS